MNRKQISFGGSTVEIAHEGGLAARVVDFLFGHLPAAASQEPYLVFTLVSGQKGDQLELLQEDTWFSLEASLPVVAEVLLGQVGHHLADKSDGGLLFHSGGVAWGGGGMILPGGIGAGKSTLTAWFLRQGFAYSTDEMVFIPEDADQYHGFARPVTIKEPARQSVQTLLSESAEEAIWCTPGIDLIPASCLGAPTVIPQAPIRLILFPRFKSDALLHWSRLTSAQSGLRLMECLVNARNLPDHGFAQVARLARMAPAYALEYGSFEQLAPLLVPCRQHLDSAGQTLE